MKKVYLVREIQRHNYLDVMQKHKQHDTLKEARLYLKNKLENSNNGEAYIIEAVYIKE